ncbi:glycosyltransferase family 2 protein [Paracoccus caeni]|uniref:Glycosyltransferase family 2 protein n=1 Tax=Paracoccus caeni TaxID=657651 RepID=A0A934VWJ3_9RHOB|nr:glycosyltransferase family 2 protein [Paracoccus caeni]MBK4218116.1 glycosyltransferase family 2 protein [Paracoccus caeni]
MTRHTSIAVIIVNYGTADLSIAAVESVLARDHGTHPVEIHLLDNASPGDDASIFAAAHAQRNWGDRVTLWPERENHGFGRGNNVVIHALGQRGIPPDYIFLLNPDAALRNDALAILADRLDRTPVAAVAGAAISLPSGQGVTAAFRFPSAFGEFVQAVNFGPISRLFRSRVVPLPPDQPDGPVNWVSGAAVMMRLAVVLKLGGFDPDFFLYYEEVELMHRIRRVGYDILYVPAAHIQHVEGAATQVKSGQPLRKPKPAYWYDSWRFYHLKTGGRLHALMAGLGWMAGAVLNAPIAVLRRNRMSMPKHFFRDFTRLVMMPLLTGRRGGQ